MQPSSTVSKKLLTQEPIKELMQYLDLRDEFREKPIRMHKTHGGKKPMFWPRVIRNAYAEIWSGKHKRVIIKAPRGGGKSKLLGTIGFDEWFLRDRSVVNMGGSQVQADIVYGYFTDYCAMHQSVANYIDGNATATETRGKEHENTFCCVTASPKQVRGKHPDILISDETCETSDDLILSALPMVNDSKNPLVIMASTFHKIYGIFQETWDGAEERGYYRIQWDIFDVCAPFDPGVWDKPEYREILGIQDLKALAKGRTGDPEGWIPIDNIIQAWREKPTLDWFLVEYIGTRPSAAGLVLKPEDVEAMFYEGADARYDAKPGAERVIGIDWGFSTMTAVVDAQKCADEVISLPDIRTYHQVKSDDIIAEVVQMVKAGGHRTIYADSAGKFENAALQGALVKERIACIVIEVVFGTEKDGMVGNLRAHSEQRKLKIPRFFKPKADGTLRQSKTAEWQLKRYRYQEGTDKPVKKDDHIPDALMCALQRFILGKAINTLHVPVPTVAKTQNASPDPEIRRDAERPITAGLLTKQF